MLRGAGLSRVFSHLYVHTAQHVRPFSSSSLLSNRDDFTISTYENGDITCHYKHKDPFAGIEHLKKLQDSIEPDTFESEMVAIDGKVALLFSAKRNDNHCNLGSFVRHVVDELPRMQNGWKKS